jgi:hypothetical protein
VGVPGYYYIDHCLRLSHLSKRGGTKIEKALAHAACSMRSLLAACHAEQLWGQVGCWPKRREKREEKVAQNRFCIFVTTFVISRKSRWGFEVI